MNKRIGISFILIITLCINLFSVSYASEMDYKKDVKGRVVKNETGEDIVYDVDITWGNMKFIYKTICTRTWNSRTHSYSESFKYAWENTGNTISITNHSNTAINAKFTYNKGAGYSSVKGTFSNNGKKVIASAVNKKLNDSSLTWKCNLNLSGAINKTLENYTTVGRVNMTID